ncbi:hypothetical protein ITJ64_04530 [Herbiconiux sp. VKM Ac-1786]|uniref:hypothetical protein n=1 Tax=Herbiconiux sp. VKM Ac-1786 TaxID=2783824 RepID=UPI00188CF192|nr:hypothetical protein [Herbiconiux sp. VKM Ac-1786]MBF4571774.1 hypothetical protein [Herbiconiux sp. VKM Ac-1786]
MSERAITPSEHPAGLSAGSSVSRRQLLQGAAWSAPVIALAVGVPAAAASTPVTRLSAVWTPSAITFGTPAVLTITTPSDLAPRAQVRVAVQPVDAGDSATVLSTGESVWASAVFGTGFVLTSDQLVAGAVYTVTAEVRGGVKAEIVTSVSTAAGGQVSTLLGYGPIPDVFVADQATDTIVRIPGGGGAEQVVVTGTGGPVGFTVTAAGDFYVADTRNSRVLRFGADGSGPTTVGAGFVSPVGVAVTASGDVYVADSGTGEAVRIPADGGTQTVIASGLDDVAAIAVSPAGDVYLAEIGRFRVLWLPADGGAQTTIGSGLDAPTSIAVSPTGDVYIADAQYGFVIRVTPDRVQTTVASDLVFPSAVTVSAAGDVFIGSRGTLDVQKVAAAGGGPTVLATGFKSPSIAIRAGA